MTSTDPAPAAPPARAGEGTGPSPGRSHRGREVVLVAHRLAAPDPTGIGRYLRELTTALAGRAGDAGWSVGLAATPEPDRPGWVPAATTVTTLGRDRRRTHLSWTVAGRPRLEGLGLVADLVHVVSPFTPIPTTIPLVWTVHDTWYLDRPEWGGRIDRWAGARALRQAANGGGLVITPTQVTADAAIAVAGIAPERIRVVAEGVGAAFHTAPATPAARAEALARHGVVDGAYLLAVGGVGPRKNLGTIVDALRRLPPAGDAPELLVVGPPSPGGAVVEDALVALGRRARRAGFVPDDDLPALFAGARAVVHPSRDEGFGLVPVEAMAAGAPVLAGEAPAVIEVTAGAACVLPDDPDVWAAAIARLADDPVWRSRLVASGRTQARRFTWDAAAAATLAVYDEALAR